MNAVTPSRWSRSCSCGEQVSVDASEITKPVEKRSCASCGGVVYFSWFEKMDIALSEACNYSCIMCRRPSDPYTLKTDAVLAVLDECANIGLRTVSFCGGEPFIHADFVDIAEHAIRLGLKVQMVTNGSMVNNKNILRLRGLDCLTVSIDGTPGAHEFIRGAPGGWKTAIGALNLALDCGITSGTNTVIQRDNAHVLWDHYEMVMEATGGRISYFRTDPVEVVPETVDLQVADEHMDEVHAQLLRIAADCVRRGVFFCHSRQLLENLPMFVRKTKRMRPANGCRIPRKFVGYSFLGFYLCWHQGRAIKAPTLLEALESEHAVSIVREAQESRCVGCNALTYSWDEEWSEQMMTGMVIDDGTILNQTTTIVEGGIAHAHQSKRQINIIRRA